MNINKYKKDHKLILFVNKDAKFEKNICKTRKYY